MLMVPADPEAPQQLNILTLQVCGWPERVEMSVDQKYSLRSCRECRALRAAREASVHPVCRLVSVGLLKKKWSNERQCVLSL